MSHKSTPYWKQEQTAVFNNIEYTYFNDFDTYIIQTEVFRTSLLHRRKSYFSERSQ